MTQRPYGPAPRLVDDPADWPTTIETAVARLTEDDPSAVFLVTGRPNESGEGAWTGDTVGIQDDLDGDHDAVVDDVVEHVLVTLLLETDWCAVDLAEQLGEIEAALAASRGGEA